MYLGRFTLRSPVHPAVFACVDGLGKVSIFNLVNKDFGQPVVEKEITDCGICRMSWSHDGKMLLFGDANGDMHLYDVAEEVKHTSFLLHLVLVATIFVFSTFCRTCISE